MFKIAMLLVVAGLVGCTRDVVTVVDAKAGTFLRRDKVLGKLYWCEKTHCGLVTNSATTASNSSPAAAGGAPPAAGAGGGGDKVFRFDSQGNPIP